MVDAAAHPINVVISLQPAATGLTSTELWWACKASGWHGPLKAADGTYDKRTFLKAGTSHLG